MHEILACRRSRRGAPGTRETTGASNPTTGATDPTGDPKAACKDLCSTTDFFMCYQPGELQACFDKCDAATDAQIEQFFNCHAGSVDCAVLVDCEKFLP